jgi:hypothetical protein
MKKKYRMMGIDNILANFIQLLSVSCTTYVELNLRYTTQLQYQYEYMTLIWITICLPHQRTTKGKPLIIRTETSKIGILISFALRAHHYATRVFA